jgi:hypothetical protein
MKKSILIIILLTGILNVSAQIQGEFYSYIDAYGYNHVYFKGTNSTQYNYNITITCLNKNTNEKKVKDYNPLNSYTYFTIGENDSWWWQPGEYLIITYDDGESVYWKYGSTNNILIGRKYDNNPSFTGSKKSDRLIEEAEYEEKWASECLYKAQIQLSLGHYDNYKSWKRNADEHSRKAKKLRDDARIERKYGN